MLHLIREHSQLLSFRAARLAWQQHLLINSVHLTDIVSKGQLVVLELLQPTLTHQTFGVEHEYLLPAFFDRFSCFNLLKKTNGPCRGQRAVRPPRSSEALPPCFHQTTVGTQRPLSTIATAPPSRLCTLQHTNHAARLLTVQGTALYRVGIHNFKRLAPP